MHERSNAESDSTMSTSETYGNYKVEDTSEEWTVEKAIASLQAFVTKDPNNAKLKVVFVVEDDSHGNRSGPARYACFITGFEHAEGYDRIELVGEFK